MDEAQVRAHLETIASATLEVRSGILEDLIVELEEELESTSTPDPASLRQP